MKTLYILDGYSSMYTSYFAGYSTGLCAPSGEPTYGTYIFVKTILKILNEYKPDMFCIAVDGPAKTFRKIIYEKYKANRKKEMPKDLLPQINRMKQILELMGFPIYYAPGFEADDVIATIVEKIPLYFPEELVFVAICSKDKDLLQLTKYEWVEVVDVYKGTGMFYDDVVEKYKLRPSQFPDYLGLVGDLTDNIPGVKGIGPKTATKLLQEFGTGENIYLNLDKIKGKVHAKLLDGQESFTLSKKLATVRKDVDIEINFTDMKRREPNWDKLNSIFEELDFESLAKEKFGNRELL